MGLFNFLKKKEEKEEIIEEKEEQVQKPKEEIPSDITKIGLEIEKLKANIEAFKEVKESLSTRINELSERIGELRGMILDKEKTIQEIELKATKAADLVEATEPEKVMGEIQKQNVKIDVIKANLEGNEEKMNQIVEELKEIRRKIEFFTGVEEIIKLSEEVKKDLIEIKKVEGEIETHSSKVETIYAELNKKIQDLDSFENRLNEQRAISEQNLKDIDYLKTKIVNFVEKEEIEKLMKKVQSYLDTLEDLQKKSSLTKDLEELKVILESLK
ncbi:MAG: hypothetical protein QW273_02260 [Candidatus Pacearchaeota archaeon]